MGLGRSFRKSSRCRLSMRFDSHGLQFLYKKKKDTRVTTSKKSYCECTSILSLSIDFLILQPASSMGNEECEARPSDPEEEIVTQVKGRHVESGHKTLLKSFPLYQYILETSVYPREAGVLKELRELTEQHSWKMMATPPDEGQFLMLLLKLMNAKKTLEVGVYTGYSLLCTALALPPDGKIIALDISREWYDIGVPVMHKAGVAHKIDFREGPAMDSIDALLQDETNHSSFDFIFVDADKDNYLNYHKRLIQLVRVGGLIGYDNTLWNGALVAEPNDPLPKYLRYYKPYILELNSFLAQDSRVQISHVPISDGVTLCRRLF